MFQDNSGKVIKGLSLNSILASGVPGTVSGMFYASKNYGTIDIESLIQPSIDLAREGFVLSDFQSKNLNKYKQKFLKNKEAKKIFTRPGGFSKGDILVQIDLAILWKVLLKTERKNFIQEEQQGKLQIFLKQMEAF